MAGGNIHCGSFRSRDKSGSALEGVLRDLADSGSATAAELFSVLADAPEYVEISVTQSGDLLPFLVPYRERLLSEMGHADWCREVEIEEANGMPPIEGKAGASRGWRFYCATDLIEACHVSAMEQEPIFVVFS